MNSSMSTTFPAYWRLRFGNVCTTRPSMKKRSLRLSTDIAGTAVPCSSRWHSQFQRANLRAMNCRERCGACCTAPSISSPIPGMPNGKPAGVRCVQLDEHERCRLFGRPERPSVCASLQPNASMCGDSREHALHYLRDLEEQTRPR